MHRFFVTMIDDAGDAGDAGESGSEQFLLSEEDARHAVKVLRLGCGDRVEAFSDEDRFLAEIVSVDGGRVLLRRLSGLDDTEPSLRVTLFQGLPKADKMDWIVQKAVELGVARIVPVRMARCVVKLDEKDAARKVDRWRKIAREACKQSGRSVVPEVTLPLNVSNLPGCAAGLSLCVVPWENCPSGGPLSVYRSHPALASLGIVIGPEGGIAPEEMNRLREAGCVPITLGKRILRTETAGLSAVSAFMALYGEMEE